MQQPQVPPPPLFSAPALPSRCTSSRMDKQRCAAAWGQGAAGAPFMSRSVMPWHCAAGGSSLDNTQALIKERLMAHCSARPGPGSASLTAGERRGAGSCWRGRCCPAHAGRTWPLRIMAAARQLRTSARKGCPGGSACLATQPGGGEGGGTHHAKPLRLCGRAAEHIARIAQFFATTLLQHFSLYVHAFTREQEHEQYTARLMVRGNHGALSWLRARLRCTPSPRGRGMSSVRHGTQLLPSI